MCELLGLSARHPATLRYSLEEFSRHGGLSGPHKDGWGVAWYSGGDVRVVKEEQPAAASACMGFLEAHPFVTRCAVSHIRRATQGAPRLANCQPFARELGGAMHVFAHNGDLDRARLQARLALGCERPLGDTDSEYAFCALLARLRPAWARAGGAPGVEERLAIVSAFAAELRALGPANFLYADGDLLFAHGHERMQADGRIAPPGLHVLTRRCERAGGSFEAEGLAIRTESAEQRAVLIASVPLTAEGGWRALAPGEIVVARDGEVVHPRALPVARAARHAAAARPGADLIQSAPAGPPRS